MKKITGNIYQISLGPVNAFIVEDDGLTLIDTGLPGNADKIFSNLKKEGKRPDDIKRIILTHCHTDHAGSAAALKQIMNISVYAHHEDAVLIEQGIGGRLMKLTPGIINRLVYHLVIKKAENALQPVQIEEKLSDNDIIPVAGGIRVIHTPGHSAGHIALLIEDEGVLIAGDICANIPSLAYSTLNENIITAQQSIIRAAGHSFDKAVFGHGGPLLNMANKKLMDKFY
jgi:glyoxylase-like metal-dependent hydrolase (beta-lactamase superfamily II)